MEVCRQLSIFGAFLHSLQTSSSSPCCCVIQLQNSSCQHRKGKVVVESRGCVPYQRPLTCSCLGCLGAALVPTCIPGLRRRIHTEEPICSAEKLAVPWTMCAGATFALFCNTATRSCHTRAFYTFLQIMVTHPDRSLPSLLVAGVELCHSRRACAAVSMTCFLPEVSLDGSMGGHGSFKGPGPVGRPGANPSLGQM